MISDGCFAAFDGRAQTERACFHPAGAWHGQLYDEEPHQMATGANCDDKMDADEMTRALNYIREMCLDHPCPGCKSKVVDKPQDDLRQCRACGHVWGFDDTQNLEDFVREFGRMQPCIVCDNDKLDGFEVVEKWGRQELICLNCRSVQGTEHLVRDRNFLDYDAVTMDQEGYGDLEPDLPDLNPCHARKLVCPFCPEVTDDFFEKEFEHGELVRVVCPGCSYVVFFTEQDNGISNRSGAPENDVAYRRALEDGRRAQEYGFNDRRRRIETQRQNERECEGADANDKIQPLPPVKKAMRYLTVKPIELLRHTLQGQPESVTEDEKTEMKSMISKQAPIMGEQMGWTIGTAVGNIVFKNPEGSGFTGTVGSIVGREVCNMILKAVRSRRVKIN